MITVRIYRNKADEITSFVMTGHADYAPHGQDLVCAAASAVSIGTINAIEKLCHITPDVSMRDEGGYLALNVSRDGLEPDTYSNIQLLLEGMIVSLESIQEGYGEYITILKKEGGATND
jgi:uncharacterized protein YsxB (DUF464 family)